MSDNFMYNVRTYGATGKYGIDATLSIQNAINECFVSGGGTVFFPAGSYSCSTINLQDNIRIFIDNGATIHAQNDARYEDGKVGIQNTGEKFTPVLINARGKKNISIEGNGTIAGQPVFDLVDVTWDDDFPGGIHQNARNAGVEMKAVKVNEPKISLVYLVDCINVTLKDISIVDSPNWSCHLQWCTSVNVRGVKIRSSLEKGVNSDGLDIDGCKNVTVSDCIIETGDDAIVLKTTNTAGESRSCENISVANCILTSTSSALKIGTESYADFKHILFSNCIIRNSNRGLSIVVRDGAHVQDVIFSHISIECNRKDFFWWGDGDPIWVVLRKRKPDSKLGRISDIVFDTIRASGQGTCKIEGFPGKPLENISIIDSQFSISSENKADKRAEQILFAHDIDNFILKNVETYWDSQSGEPKWTEALKLSHIDKLRLESISCCQAPATNSSAILLDQVQDVIVQHCIAQPLTRTFIHVCGDATKKVLLRRNNAEYANSLIKHDDNLSAQIKVE